MTVWYVGPGGNNNNSGRTWGTRLLTLNGAEDKPVVAGDTVIVAPGVYRELLTVDVSGTAGNPITYVGDVTGENTDGVGGPVRITGSNNDQSWIRANCISANDKDYRTFRGFHLDFCSAQGINTTNGCQHWTIEDCVIKETYSFAIQVLGAGQSNFIIRRCLFIFGQSDVGGYVRFGHDVAVDDSDHLVENCIFDGSLWDGVTISRIGDVTVRNCLFHATGDDGVDVSASPNAGHAANVNNCIFVMCTGNAVEANALGDLIEDYNVFYLNATDRSNVNVGANSTAYAPLFQAPLLSSGYRLPWWYGALSRWSQVSQRTGDGNEPLVDLFGIHRPQDGSGTVSSLSSWGAIQWFDFLRSELRSYDGSVSALVREKQKTWMFVPVTNTEHTISVRAWRNAGYGGNRNPTMVIKQAGQPTRVTEDAGAAAGWNLLTDTFTPAANPPWLTVELWNNCDFTSTTTTSTTSTSTLSTTSTTTQTVTTLTTTTTTLACDVHFDALNVS